MTPSPPPCPPGSRARWLLACFLLLAIFASYLLGLGDYLSWDYLHGQLERLQTWARENPLAAVTAFHLAFVAVALLALPGAGLLMLLAGALFESLLVAVLVVNCASTAGAIVSFLVTRYLLRDLIERWLGARLGPINRGVAEGGAWYLLTLRMIPGIPFFLINPALALTRMPLGTFWLVSQFGMLPVTIVLVNAGRQLGQVEAPADALSPSVLLSLTLAGTLPIILRFLFRAFLTRRPTP